MNDILNLFEEKTMTEEEMISVKFVCDVITICLVVIFTIWCLKKRK